MIKDARELTPGDVVVEYDPHSPDIVIDRYVIARVWTPSLRPNTIATLAAGDKIPVLWHHGQDVEVEDAVPGLEPTVWLAHADGCKNGTHNPATSLCTNELIWPYST